MLDNNVKLEGRAFLILSMFSDFSKVLEHDEYGNYIIDFGIFNNNSPTTTHTLSVFVKNIGSNNAYRVSVVTLGSGDIISTNIINRITSNESVVCNIEINKDGAYTNARVVLNYDTI